MRRSLIAGVAYFATIFAAGFTLGAIRTLFVAPRVGATLAVALELPLILTLAWMICRRLYRAFRVPHSRACAGAMGGVAFALLLGAEIGISMLLGARTIQEHFSLYGEPSHLLGLAGQIGFGLFPVLQSERSSERI